jgi:putative protease
LIPIELLSPAKNVAYGKAAILHGADAVYIGASYYGARAEAANTIPEIAELVRFAHLYRAKAYVTINTILFDQEIENAVSLAWELYEAGVDALIIQDMGLMQCHLPPLPLFASTQTHNHTPEKIKFLEDTGFQRVILARELTLDEIREIRLKTRIELECFVHGALCVSYSGQCYMSHAITGRSGNRGTCAQPCRSSYRLLDASGNTLINDARLLSLKDLNLSDFLPDLLEAGVTSFKIEGRLKDINYVKNITAFYRQHLDAVFKNKKAYDPASSGKTIFNFTPNPYKTFNRGYTDYFVKGCRKKVASLQTQKSLGEKLGKVNRVHASYFTIDTPLQVSNGDGLCWIHPQKGIQGVLVNKVEGGKIFPARPVDIPMGTEIYRNNDFCFEKQLSVNSSDRRIGITFKLEENETGYTVMVEDEDGNRTDDTFETEKIPAKDIHQAQAQIKKQLGKLGNTVFSLSNVIISPSFGYFIPAAVLNEMRRQVILKLENIRMDIYHAKKAERPDLLASYPEKKVGYLANIANQQARKFYEKYGVEVTEKAFELQSDYRGKLLMVTKHCIKYQYGLCPFKQQAKQKWKEPLLLQDQQNTYRIQFDCKLCVMKIYNKD